MYMIPEFAIRNTAWRRDVSIARLLLAGSLHVLCTCFQETDCFLIYLSVLGCVSTFLGLARRKSCLGDILIIKGYLRAVGAEADLLLPVDAWYLPPNGYFSEASNKIFLRNYGRATVPNFE